MQYKDPMQYPQGRRGKAHKDPRDTQPDTVGSKQLQATDLKGAKYTERRYYSQTQRSSRDSSEAQEYIKEPPFSVITALRDSTWDIASAVWELLRSNNWKQKPWTIFTQHNNVHLFYNKTVVFTVELLTAYV